MRRSAIKQVAIKYAYNQPLYDFNEAYVWGMVLYGFLVDVILYMWQQYGFYIKSLEVVSAYMIFYK